MQKFFGAGVGGWGMGVGGLAPSPNPQSPIPNPHKCNIIFIIFLYYIINIIYIP
jgi:hypothetical protein